MKMSTRRFRACLPQRANRQAFIARAAAEAKPSFGHLRSGLDGYEQGPGGVDNNFDGLVEDAGVQVFGSISRLTVAQIEAAQIALDAVAQSRWPLLGKLHGDFRSTG
jgi:hypothetical protein